MTEKGISTGAQGAVPAVSKEVASIALFSAGDSVFLLGAGMKMVHASSFVPVQSPHDPWISRSCSG